MDSSFENFLKNLAQPVITCDRHGKIIFTNKHSQELFGYSESEFLELIAEDLVKQEMREAHIKLREDFVKNTKFIDMGNRIIDTVKKNGEVVKIKVSLSPYEERLILIISDYSEEVSYKNELIEFFNKDKSGSEKSDFINHLLKGPISHMISELKSSKHRESEEFKDLFREIDHLNQNIDNLKEVIDVDSNQSQDNMKFEHLLVVDDSSTVHKFIKAVSKTMKYDSITYSENGKDGLEKLQAIDKNNILILLDINMPVMNGYEFLEEITNMRETIKVIMYSSSDNLEEVSRCLSYKRVISYLVKPASIKLLKQKIFSLL